MQRFKRYNSYYFLLLNVNKMKQKISISIGEETILKLDECLKKEIFRNKSHIIEIAINKFLREEEE